MKILSLVGWMEETGLVVVAHDWLIECIGMYTRVCISSYVLDSPSPSFFEASGISESLLAETQDLF